MNDTQRKFLIKMLEMASDEFSNHTCNDYVIENTPENLDFVYGIIKAGDYPEDEPNISSDGKEIYLMDWQVMNYLIEVLKAESEAWAPHKVTGKRHNKNALN